MAAEIVNLRQARKARARRSAKVEADANATLHGLSRPARAAARAETEARDRALDGAKRDRPDTDG